MNQIRHNPERNFLHSCLLVQEPLRQETAFPTSMCYCPITDAVSQPTLSITNHPKCLHFSTAASSDARKCGKTVSKAKHTW